jgi:hypothetical protein
MAWSRLIPVLRHGSKATGTRQIGVHVTVAARAGRFGISRLLDWNSAAGEWIARDLNLDNWISENSYDRIGWRTLQVVHLVVRGMILWIDTWNGWRFLASLCSSLFRFTAAERLLSLPWASVGLVMGLLALIDFALILRFEYWHLSETFWITMLNRLILLPVWLVWLCYQLPRAKACCDTEIG